MPPAAAVASTVSSSPSTTILMASNREMAASEDVYFGEPRQQQPQHQQEGLLGQALQIPSTRSDEAISGHEDISHSSAASFTERATPTFVTRKRSSGNSHNNDNSNNNIGKNHAGGIQTPTHQNSTNSSEPAKTTAAGSRMNHQDTFRSTTSTYVTNNRDGRPRNNSLSQASSSEGGENNGNFPLRPHDPLCLSHRSYLSEDSSTHLPHHHHSNNNNPMVIPQSVDTVPTSNVATFQAYQRQHKYNQHRNTGTNANTMHTDDTELYSNRKPLQNSPEKMLQTGVSPPRELTMANSSTDNNNNNNNSGGGRRTVFGNRVRQRYPTPSSTISDNIRMAPPPPMDPAPFYNIIERGSQITFQQAAPQPPDWQWTTANSNNHPVHDDDRPPSNNNNNNSHAPPPLSMVVTAQNSHHDDVMNSALTLEDFHSPRNNNNNGEVNSSNSMVSPLQSPPLRLPQQQQQSTAISHSTNSTCTTTALSKIGTTTTNDTNNHNNRRSSSVYHKKHKRRMKIHETVHAQSLLLGLCFMAIWSPNNIMAPNLTQIATFYGMTENERDLYLGSFLALATGVLSFPLSAAIGILTDLYSRKILFVGTAVGGALASAATGLSPTYPCLLLARFFSGGFMSASVSVAFSLMGDLFAAEERNAASSGLTAMMGLGIILGQVYAGVVGSTQGWQIGFWISSGVTAVLGLCVAIWVQEPVRGGKEKVLQDMIQQGKRYDRKLTWAGFMNAMQNNRSNAILMAQGFFSSLPFGILFVFFNDYLSQERGFSVPDATFIVLVFGVGCAAGGVLGGYLGAKIQAIRRPLLPLFMAATTMLGILPFFGLLNGHTTNAHGYWSIFYAFMGGCFSSMPSVNVRPCLINVNPPETRGASLTAANLIINLARGLGPSCITILGSSFQLSRQVSFNVTLGVFWTLSAIQLCYLAKSLPEDQDRMEAELARYAASALATTTPSKSLDGTDRSSLMAADEFSLEPERPDSNMSLEDDVSLVSIEDRMTTFDNVAVRESISFIQKGMRELNFRPLCAGPHRGLGSYDEEDDSDPDDIEDYDKNEQRRREEAALHMRVPRAAGDDTMSRADLWKRRNMWIQQQQKIYGSTVEGQRDDNDDANARTAEERESNDGVTPTENTRLV